MNAGPAASENTFDLTGGTACLDFTNTVDGRLREAPRDRLAGYADLVLWAEQAGVIEGADAVVLGKEAEARPAEAKRVLAAARELRETLYAIFSSVAAGERASEGSVAKLNEALPAMLSARLVPADGSFEWSWSLDASRLDGMLAPVLRDAAELLTSADVSRVRQCEADDCAWLFLDRSRNRSRRWCDMSVCGNRAKARRHYRRTKGAA